MSEYDSLTDFAGITESRADELRALGIQKPEHITYTDADTLATVDGLSGPLAKRVHSMAIEEFGEPDEQQPTEAEDDVIKELYFCDETPRETEPKEYRIMIGPDMSPDADEEGWAIYRTAEEMYMPNDTELYIFKSGSVVSVGRQTFRLHLAQIVGDYVDKSEFPGRFIDFPEEYSGALLPKVDYVSDEELNAVLSSVTVDQLIGEQMPVR